MENSTHNNSGTLTTAIKGLGKFDGRKPGEFRDRHKRMAVVLGVTRRDIASIMKGKARPSESTPDTGATDAQASLDKATAEFDKANEDLYAILYLLTEKPAALLVSKHEDATGTSGDGQKALQDLVGKYNKVTDEVIRAKMETLVNTPMTDQQDPDDFFMEKTLARAELEKMGEPISDRRFKDICVTGFTSDYKDIKLMMYRDPTFDIDQMQATMRHLYLDDLSRGSSSEKIAGRGTAMSAETSACDYCGKKGHQEGNCWKKRDETKRANKKHSGSKAGDAGQRWCSVHQTTSHSDEKYYA